VGHEWTFKEAACAAAASPKLFEPFEISHGAQRFLFEDASFRLASNPSQLALNDLVDHPIFKNREIGCFVSLGAGRAASPAQISDNSSHTLWGWLTSMWPVSQTLWDWFTSRWPVSHQTLFESMEKLAKDSEEVHQYLLKAPQT
jgi:hypothetical protein